MEAEQNTPASQAENETQKDESQEPPAEYSEDEHLTAIDKQYAATQSGVPRRIHILGTGSIGKLVAHSLKGIAKPPPITLIFHRYSLLKAWEEGKKQVIVHTDGFDVPRGGYEVELMPEVRKQHGVEVQKAEGVYDIADGEEGGGASPHEVAQALREMRRQRQHDSNPPQEEDSKTQYTPLEQQTDQNPPQEDNSAQFTPLGQEPDEKKPAAHATSDGKNPAAYAISDEPIHNLIVTTKAAVTVPALSAIAHRILPTSTICFLQNGMGIIDEVNSSLFPREEDRPNYMQGIITHGANVPPEKAAQDPFYAVHAGHGSIAIGLLPRGGMENAEQGKDEKDVQSEKWAPSSRYLLRTLTRCPVLCAVGFTPLELLQQQLEKLVMNCTINPLTSLIDARNGALLYNFALTRTIRLLLAEISHVILNLPELRNIPNVPHRFSTERLEGVVFAMCKRTQNNISSMLADVRAGQKTEIEYINGYIVKRGEEMGFQAVVNYAIMQTVMGKAQMTSLEKQEEVPTAGKK